MSTGFTLATRAHAEHERLKQIAISAVNNRLKTSEQAWDDYIVALTDFLRDARQEVDDDRMIQTKCASCSSIHHMNSHVAYYRCHCSPHEDRFPFNERVVLDAE